MCHSIFEMTAEEITLNIAVNLGRIGRFGLEGKEKRVKQFIAETEEYLKALEKAEKKERFMRTYEMFQRKFNSEIKGNRTFDDAWAETAFTWANILTHRAKLA